MSEAPNFSQANWLDEVLKREPEYYKNPVVYEFANGAGQKREFVKDDAQWYQGFE